VVNRLRKVSLRGWLLLGVAAAAACVGIVSYETGALSSVELSTTGTRFGIRGTESPGDQIVIVALDAASDASFDLRPPIPRSYYARLFDRLHGDRPRLIVADVQFIGKTDPSDDTALLTAIARDSPIELATHDAANGPIPVPAGVAGAKGAVLATASVIIDSDGVLRRMMYAPIKLVTLAVRAAELSGTAVSPGDFPDNSAWIDFRGPPGTFPTYSFASVLAGKVPSSALAGKIVLVGVTDPVEKDVFVTDVSSNPMSGVEIWANSIWTILHGFPLQPAGTLLDLLLVILLAALPAVASSRLAVLYTLGLCALGLIVFLVIVQVAFDAGTIIDVPDPILALLLGCVGAVAAESFVERRQRRAFEDAIGLARRRGPQFFISYRRSQSRWPARILADSIAKRFGKSSVFMDRDAIEAGQMWPKRIEQALSVCTVMLVLIGPEWLDVRDQEGRRRLDDEGDWVRRELEMGLAREETVVVPVLLDGAAMPVEHSLPDGLRDLVYCHAIALAGDDPEKEITEMVDSIQKGRIRQQMVRQTVARAED
jgi:CHASE2 domain-containing sensor protein